MLSPQLVVVVVAVDDDYCCCCCWCSSDDCVVVVVADDDYCSVSIVVAAVDVVVVAVGKYSADDVAIPNVADAQQQLQPRQLQRPVVVAVAGWTTNVWQPPVQIADDDSIGQRQQLNSGCAGGQQRQRSNYVDGQRPQLLQQPLAVGRCDVSGCER